LDTLERIAEELDAPRSAAAAARSAVIALTLGWLHAHALGATDQHGALCHLLVDLPRRCAASALGRKLHDHLAALRVAARAHDGHAGPAHRHALEFGGQAFHLFRIGAPRERDGGAHGFALSAPPAAPTALGDLLLESPHQ